MSDLYRSAGVRDFVWAATSPPLFCGPLARALPTRLRPLRVASSDEGPREFAAFDPEIDRRALLRFAASLDGRDVPALQRARYRRLGAYFEALSRFLFTEGWKAGVTPYRLLDHNIQLAHEGSTQGELDMLLQHEPTTLVHVEAALKFYLSVEGRPEWCDWVGPNARDRLDIKLARLTEHQLPLIHRSEHAARRQEWLKRSGADTLESRHYLKGALFIRSEKPVLRSEKPVLRSEKPVLRSEKPVLRSEKPVLRSEKPVLPRGANPDLERGEWHFAHESAAIVKEFSELAFCSKMDWLSGPDGADAPEFERDPSGVSEMVLPAMRMSPQRRRVMVVPDAWPRLA